ncbi:MAG TPA: ornithine cyclodeaminase family protein [Blastocatellia bacterium]|nr:ornithine cyclodeaminase family protein [Blastocatellia bacterium]
MLILNEQALREALTMAEVIDAVEHGFLALARGALRVPDRLRLNLPGGVLLEMPAAEIEPPANSGNPQSGGPRKGTPVQAHSGQRALGTKIVSVFEGNASLGLAVVQSLYVLLDGSTGVPLALMEGRFITGIRTAAVSALATKHMLPPGPQRLAVFGAGTQAAFHVEAMLAVTPLERVSITSRTVDRARSLVETVSSSYGLDCGVSSPEHAVAEATIICTCTTSAVPLFAGNLLNSGTHINAVGAFAPGTRELDSETIRRARVFIDERSAAGREAGEILTPVMEGVISYGHIKGTLAEVVAGEVPGRVADTDVTVFKSCGLALEDLFTARLAYEVATQKGLGASVDL